MEQVADALLVPTIALQQSNNLYQVLVPNTTDPAGEPETVPVEIGLSDGTYTQITKGLNLGDQVLVEVSTSASDETQMMGRAAWAAWTWAAVHRLRHLQAAVRPPVDRKCG